MKMRYFAILIFAWSQLELASQVRYDSKLFNNIDTKTYPFGSNTKYDGSTQNLSLDVYTGTGDLQKNRACVVFCFGGAFVTGNRSSTEILYFANFLAQLGYVCVSIDYRLDDIAHIASFNDEAKASIRAVQDAKAAIRYLKFKSNDLGIDTNRIIIGGTSAGGIIALTLGYSQYSEFNTGFQSIIDSLGGWEGTSNSLSNSSKVIGLFNFSGAILDTAHIQNNDLPVYLDHAVYDATVPFTSGYPLNGQSYTKVYGSKEIYNTMTRKGGLAILNYDSTSYHPRFNAGFNVLTESYNTYLKLKPFLYNLVKSSGNTSAIIRSENNPIAFYPNPANEFIHVDCTTETIDLEIVELTGKRVFNYSGDDKTIDIRMLQAGVYFIKVNSQTFPLIKD